MLALWIALALIAGWFAHDLYLQDRRRRMRVKWPIPTVPLADLDPVFRTNELGPTLDTEVSFVGRGPLVVPGGTSDAEAWVLSTRVIRRPTRRSPPSRSRPSRPGTTSVRKATTAETSRRRCGSRSSRTSC